MADDLLMGPALAQDALAKQIKLTNELRRLARIVGTSATCATFLRFAPLAVSTSAYAPFRRTSLISSIVSVHEGTACKSVL